MGTSARGKPKYPEYDPQQVQAIKDKFAFFAHERMLQRRQGDITYEIIDKTVYAYNQARNIRDKNGKIRGLNKSYTSKLLNCDQTILYDKETGLPRQSAKDNLRKIILVLVMNQAIVTQDEATEFLQLIYPEEQLRAEYELDNEIITLLEQQQQSTPASVSPPAGQRPLATSTRRLPSPLSRLQHRLLITTLFILVILILLSSGVIYSATTGNWPWLRLSPHRSPTQQSTHPTTPTAPVQMTPEMIYHKYTSGKPSQVDPQPSSPWTNGSPTDGECQDENGQGYHAIPARQGSFATCVSPTRVTGDFALQADLTILQGTGAGLVFGFSPSPQHLRGNYYLFGFCRVFNKDSCVANNVFLNHIADFQTQLCFGPVPAANYHLGSSACTQSSPAIHSGAGQTNTLTVIVLQGTIYLYLNATFILSFQPTSLIQGACQCDPGNLTTTGQVGIAGLEGKDPTDVTWQQVRIWRIQA